MDQRLFGTVISSAVPKKELSSETTRVKRIPVRRTDGCFERHLHLRIRRWRCADEPSTPPSQPSPKLEQLTISPRRSSFHRREKEDQAQERQDETDFNHQFQNAKETLSAMIGEKRLRSSERKASRVLRKAATVRVNAPGEDVAESKLLTSELLVHRPSQ